MSKKRLDLHEVTNVCSKHCNQDVRKWATDENICLSVHSSSDALPVRCVGEWAADKVYYLNMYFRIFVKGMKNKWENLNYIEIGSGPGRCIDRNNGVEFDGSALAIIKDPSFSFLSTATFIDVNPDVVSILNQRIRKQGISERKALAVEGDYNQPKELVGSILNRINLSSLNLVFIDPTDCGIPFTLIQEIKSRLKNVDFIINVAVGTDVSRNIGRAIRENDAGVRSKYIRFLGSDRIFMNEKSMSIALKGSTVELRNQFREEYKISLKGIGYEYFDYLRIRNLYDLLYAASHKCGIDFWKEATKIPPDGQRKLEL